MLLEIANLSVSYGKLRAVADVSLSVPSGAIIAIIGSNGSGKSTTLRAVSGLISVAGGTISYAGRSIVGLAPHAIARLGIAHVPEGRGVLSSITVRDNLRIGSWGGDKNVPAETLQRQVFEYFPQLRQRLNQPAGVLSGGEQQMLSLARALLKAPKMMMVDEMSLGLAPKVVEQLMEVIVDLAKTGTSILCVEQNTRVILRHADFGYVLENGRSVLNGPATDLLASPQLVRAYLGRKAGKASLL